jgi:hypothetical protein
MPQLIESGTVTVNVPGDLTRRKETTVRALGKPVQVVTWESEGPKRIEVPFRVFSIGR